MRNTFLKHILQNQFLIAIFIVLVGWFALEIKDILAGLLISYIIMAALLPLVELLRKNKIPRTLAVLIAYFTTLIFILLLILPLIPFFVSQIQSLFDVFPRYLDRTASLLGINIDIKQINSFVSSEIANIGKSAVTVTGKVFGGIFSVLTILVVSFYLLLNYDHLRKSFAKLFPKELEEGVKLTLIKIDEKLGAWVRGQIMLSAIIAVISWTALTLLDMPFALPLALLAGILEIIPIIGPILSSIPAIIVALAISPTMGITVAIFYLVVQMLENNILVPKIMQKTVGLNPVVVILGVMIGTRFMGIIGALLAVPFISMLIIIFKTLRQGR